MKRLLIVLLAITLIFVAFDILVVFGKRSKEAERSVNKILNNIHAEIKSLGNHEWAGEYYEGDGLGENVSFTVAPKAGFVFEWHGCLGLYDRNYGSVTATNAHLQLTFNFKNERKGFQGLAPELISVRWGERRYLVPADDLIGFCNAVNSRGEPRDDMHGRYLLRQGDEKKKVSGKPSVPAEFTGYLLKSPVKAEIIKVISSKSWTNSYGWQIRETSVLINAGKKQGLLSGMELSVTSPDIVESLTVKTVAEQQAEGIIKQIDEKHVPEIGWKFSTIPRWRLREYQATSE